MPTIAVIGASSERRKFGNKCVRAYQSVGYDVYPIHPRETLVEGLQTYASIAELPLVHLDRVSIYLPPTVGVTFLDTLVGRDIGEVWLNPGADAPEVVAKGRALGLPIVCGCSIVNVGVSPADLD